MLTFEADHANFGPQNNKIIKDRCLMRQNLFSKMKKRFVSVGSENLGMRPN